MLFQDDNVHNPLICLLSNMDKMIGVMPRINKYVLSTGNSGEPPDNKYGIVTMLSDLNTTNQNSYTMACRPSDTIGFNISESKTRQVSIWCVH